MRCLSPDRLNLKTNNFNLFYGVSIFNLFCFRIKKIETITVF